MEKNTLTITLVLHQHMKLEKETAREIANELREYKIVDENDHLFTSPETYDEDRAKLAQKIDKFRHKTKPNRNDVAKFMQNLCDEYFEIDLDSFNMIIKTVSDKMTEQIQRIIESQLISPWSTLGVSALTDAMSKRIQHYCLVNENQNSDSQNDDQKKYDELAEKQKNNQPLTDEEKNFINSFGSFRLV